MFLCNAQSETFQHINISATLNQSFLGNERTGMKEIMDGEYMCGSPV